MQLGLLKESAERTIPPPHRGAVSWPLFGTKARVRVGWTRFSRPSRGCRYMTDVLQLQFPWSSLPVAVPNPSSLTPRQYKYLQWCLHSKLPSLTRNRRLLALLGLMTYRQARWPRIQKWH